MDIFSIFNIFITPEAGLIADTGTRILYGLGLGLVANFVYRAGLSHLSKKLGIESKITNSISPPPGDITL